MRKAPAVALAAMILLVPAAAAAHHVLGRPAYSLSEDSNTPPSMQVETQIGEYFVTAMVFPAFPKPEMPGRINLYASRIDDGAPFAGKVTFTVRDDGWLSWLAAGEEETLGVQPPDENVFRQGFVFNEAGDYVVTAAFEAGGEPYLVDVPLRIGKPTPVGPIGVTVGLLVIVLVTVSVIQRRRAMTGKIRSAREELGDK